MPLGQPPPRAKGREEIVVTFGFRWPTGVTAALILALATGTALAATAVQFVQVRRAQFGEMSDALKFAADRWRDPGAYGEVAQSALVIQRDARHLLQLFPKGTSASDGLRTAALDSIWSERPGFERLANQLADEAGGLAAITETTPSSNVRQQLVAIIGTCKSCHRDYRAQ
jgi:cytochrome c556